MTLQERLKLIVERGFDFDGTYITRKDSPDAWIEIYELARISDSDFYQWLSGFEIVEKEIKTLIIYNDCESVKYFITDGDYSKFHGITFNVGLKNDLERACSDWLWTNEGIFKHQTNTDISTIENKNWDKCALITWVP